MKRILILSFLVSALAQAGISLKQTIANYVGSENYVNINERAVQDKSQVQKSELNLYPNFSITAYSGRSENTTVDLKTNNEKEELVYFKPKSVTVEMRQSFQFGKDLFNWQAAVLDQKSSLVSSKDQRENLIMGGILLHMQGYVLQKRKHFLNERKSYVKRNLQVLKDRLEHGVSSLTEKDRMLDRYDQVKLELYDLDGMLKNLKLRYHTETGKPVNYFHQIPMRKLNKYMPKSKREFLARAKKSDTTIVRSQYSYSSAAKRTEAAQAALYPKLEFLLSNNTDAQVNVNKRKTISKFTVTLTHDLFSSGKSLVDFNTARSKERVAKFGLQQAKRNLDSVLENIWFRYQSAKLSLRAARNKLARLGRIFQRQQAEFKAARISISDLLDAEEELSRAGEDVLQKEFAVANMTLQIIKFTGAMEKALDVNLSGENA